MTPIATTSPGAKSAAPFVASNDDHVPADPRSRGSRSSAIDSVATKPAGALLTPRQQMMADMESLIGVFLQIFIASRTAAREHNLYLRESVARMVELEADKMMSAALMQLVGGVIQGTAGIVSGAMQIKGAVGALRTVRNGVKGVEPKMKQESDALKALNDAKGQHEKASSSETKSAMDAAQANYDTAKSELSQAWSHLRAGEDYKSIDAIVAKWNGAGSVTKGGGR